MTVMRLALALLASTLLRCRAADPPQRMLPSQSLAEAAPGLDISCDRGVLTVTQLDMGAGLCPLLVCCPKNCPLCADRANCLKHADDPSCCPKPDIATSLQHIDTGLSDIEVSCRYKAPPCTMPPADDPCVDRHGAVCRQDARCGVRYVSDAPSYVQGTSTSTDSGCIGAEAYCACPEGFTGPRCERKCKKGQTPCGYGYSPVRSKSFGPNDICCARDRVCVKVGEHWGYNTRCLPKGRPQKCTPSKFTHPQVPDPCRNGGKCVNLNYWQQPQYAAYVCRCAKGFHGPLCQYKDK